MVGHSDAHRLRPQRAERVLHRLRHDLAADTQNAEPHVDCHQDTRLANGSEDVIELQRAQYAQIEHRSEEHTSELQSLMRISYAVFCLKKKNHKTTQQT